MVFFCNVQEVLGCSEYDISALHILPFSPKFPEYTIDSVAMAYC